MTGRRLETLTGISLAEQAKTSIRGAILDGTIKPQERITIEQLAADLGISRTPVREALKALELDGIVRLLRHRGAVVEGLARDELVNRYVIRSMLEGFAAELACRADEDGHLAAALRANCDALEAAAALADTRDPEQVRPLGQLNHAFHALILEGSGSATLKRLLETLRNPFSFTLFFWSDSGRQLTSIKSHRAIAHAFEAKVPERARSLTERHLLDARDHLMHMPY